MWKVQGARTRAPILRIRGKRQTNRSERPCLPWTGGPSLLAGRASTARSVFERTLAVTHLETIAAIHRLDIKDITCSKSEHALDRGGDVFVHAVRKLDHYHGAFPWRAYQATTDSPGTTAKLAEHDLHDKQSSNLRARVQPPG